MGECKIDHSHQDVKKKYGEQKSFLPGEINLLFDRFFMKEHPQETLNEVFHLLKKYDLSSAEEKENRNQKLKNLIKSSE